MHSINQYLPIGESDSQKALDWDKIPEVNFRRPEGEFKYTESIIESLRTSSINRQKLQKSLDYLEKNIVWFKHKKKTKNLSHLI